MPNNTLRMTIPWEMIVEMTRHSEILNWIIVMLGLVAIWYQWKAYRILRSPAFILTIAALIYLTIYRAALPYYPFLTTYGVAMPFYLLMIAHGIVMTHSLNRVLEASFCEDVLEQSDKPSWKPTVDYVTTAVIVTVLIAVFVFEILEIWVWH